MQFGKRTDELTTKLVYGYINKIIIKNKFIPADIIQIIIKYARKNSQVLYNYNHNSLMIAYISLVNYTQKNIQTKQYIHKFNSFYYIL